MSGPSTDLVLAIDDPGELRVDPALVGDVDGPAPDTPAATIPEVAEDTTRAFLQGVVGGGVGLLLARVGVTTPGAGRFTDDELADIAPALTRYVNRNRTLRVAGQHADLVVVAAAGLRYTARTVSMVHQAKAAEQEVPDDRSRRPDHPAAGGPTGP